MLGCPPVRGQQGRPRPQEPASRRRTSHPRGSLRSRPWPLTLSLGPLHAFPARAGPHRTRLYTSAQFRIPNIAFSKTFNEDDKFQGQESVLTVTPHAREHTWACDVNQGEHTGPSPPPAVLPKAAAGLRCLSHCKDSRLRLKDNLATSPTLWGTSGRFLGTRILSLRMFNWSANM